MVFEIAPYLKIAIVAIKFGENVVKSKIRTAKFGSFWKNETILDKLRRNPCSFVE
jgi:hypothetical protein